jgi:hypothetical protein
MGALTEYVFSHAVALNQSGRLRNSIYVHNRDVYILNMDHTLLINFTLPSREPTFNNPIAFAANDYDSENFTEEDGKIVFTQKADGLIRRKICSSADGNFEDVKKTFHAFWKSASLPSVTIDFSIDHLALLQESLSHLEFKAEDGRWRLTQRDIYTGNLIEIEDSKSGATIKSIHKRIEDFDPIGIRTNDFMALFQFQSHVSFYFFPGSNARYCLFDAKPVAGEEVKYKMRGILAGCVYDEMGIIETAEPIKEKTHGRKKSQNRAGESQADSPVGKTTRRRRT